MRGAAIAAIVSVVAMAVAVVVASQTLLLLSLGDTVVVVVACQLPVSCCHSLQCGVGAVAVCRI